MAGYYDINNNSVCNVNCSLSAKFIKILQHEPGNDMKLKCDKCNTNALVALCITVNHTCAKAVTWYATRIIRYIIWCH